ncbi:hypothetical protein OZX65_03955 [Leuconostocaceae bacterium ESL0723]|nr:hypothetical protein [Lactobacillaceae bacterium L1_55_11]WEV53889.1 hypothetical protein OZX65_03955 [Leuconostocaceae bacterium ESL0723]
MGPINKWVPDEHGYVPAGIDANRLTPDQRRQLKQLKNFLEEGVISSEDYRMKVHELGIQTF